MSLNFREREPLKTPTRHFEIPTSDLGPPPPGRSSVLLGRVVRKLINAIHRLWFEITYAQN